MSPRRANSQAGEHGRFDLGGRPVTDEYRQPAPLDGDRLALGNVRNVELDAGKRQHRSVGVERVDERPGNACHANCANRACRDIKKVAPARSGAFLMCRIGLRRQG